MSPAKLWRASAGSGGLDGYGDPVVPTFQTWDCEGFRENYSAFYRKAYEIPETDAKVNIFAGSLPRGFVPRQDDKVFMEGIWWQLRKANTDPATALWVCQAFEGVAPEGVTCP